MAIRITKVYTRAGDKGNTALIRGRKVSKASLRVAAYGHTDNLGAHIGFLISQLPEQLDDVATKLIRIQQELFDLGSVMATLPEDREDPKMPLPADIPEHFVSRLEQEMDQWNEVLEELPSFILAGGGPAGAYAHVCRTQCRETERALVALSSEGDDAVPVNAMAYINRLSDYLFVLARHISSAAGFNETLWAPGRTDS